MDEPVPATVLRRVARRLLPILFLMYVVNILDRVNIGFAKLQMLDDLGLPPGERDAVYGFAAGVFYLGYFAFEIPSNLILHRVGARRWLCRILVSWGVVSCATMAVQGAWSLYLLRILLGLAEAGFFPGIILYLTYWFPARERARAVALFMAASPLAGILGQPLSGAIMTYLDGAGGLRGWQWVFLLEGVPAVVLGVVVFFYLTDRPENAHWLWPEERTWLALRLAGEDRHPEKHHGFSLGILRDGRVWLLILVYFTVAASSNTMGYYLPSLIENRSPSLTKFEIGLLAAIPNVVALVCMILNGAHSDSTGERHWHVAGPAFVAAAGWAISAAFISLKAGPSSLVLSLGAFCLIQAGTMSVLPVFWSLPTAFLGGAAAAGGIALVNALGNLGAFAGSNIMGQLQKAYTSYAPGLLAMSLLVVTGGLTVLWVRYFCRPAPTSEKLP